MALNTYNKKLKDQTINNFIDENINFENLIKKIFEVYMTDISKHHKLLSDLYDVENLHQLRISLRKFKSFLSFIKNDISKKEWKYANRLYKYLIKPTSKARDYDVFKSEYLSSLNIHQNTNELKEMNKIFEEKQNALHLYIEDYLTSEQYISFLDQLNIWIFKWQWRNKPLKHAKITGEELMKFINEKIRHRYKNIIKIKKHVLDFNQKELHRYRVDIKELRYVLEKLGPYINGCKKEEKFLKSMQDILGKINDTYTAENIAIKLNTRNTFPLSRSYLEEYALDQRHRYLIQLRNIK